MQVELSVVPSTVLYSLKPFTVPRKMLVPGRHWHTERMSIWAVLAQGRYSHLEDIRIRKIQQDG